MSSEGMPEYPEEQDRDLYERYNVIENLNTDAVICIEGSPVAPQARLDRLKSVLRTVVANFGRMKEGTLYLPVDEKGDSKGYFFVEFEDAQEAERALKLADGFRLDKNHLFKARFFNDILTYGDVPDEWTQPPKPEFREREHLRSWLSDKGARDQFAVIQGNETLIYWNMKNTAHDLVRSRREWTESQLQWSPQGSYLCTFHAKGIALWGGPEWVKIVRFPHNGVKYIDFSPHENYLVTWASVSTQGPDGKPYNTAVWQVRTGKLLRTFQTPADQWPILKWSQDDKYVARLTDDAISVFETPSMNLLDKKSIIAVGVRDFAWSPKQNILSFWTPEEENNPARVTLMEIPSRNLIRTKNLFNVKDCKFFWQSEGDFLLVNVSRLKGKKSEFTNLELFRLKEKGVPVEVLEFPEENLPLVSWEPKGTIFLLGGDGPQVSLSFYSVEKTIKLNKTLEKKSINRISWCPKGQFVVLASLGAPVNGSFEFWNAKDVEMMSSGEHYLCTDFEWDPTGRYFTTVVSCWGINADTGYKLWDFKGEIVQEKILDKFAQFIWRPRPPTLLSKEKLKEIKKNLSKYSEVFIREDEEKDTSAAAAARVARRKVFESWRGFMDKISSEYKKQKPLREELRGCASDDEGDLLTIEDLVEEVVEETKTQVG